MNTDSDNDDHPRRYAGYQSRLAARARDIAARRADALALTDVLRDDGHEVQTTRVALAPYYDVMPANGVAALPRAVQEIEDQLNGLGVGYVSFGPIRWRVLGDHELPNSLRLRPTRWSLRLLHSSPLKWPMPMAFGTPRCRRPRG